MKSTKAIMTSILATVCRVCPLCICARRWPASRLAKAVKGIEGFCPACRAYAKLKQGNINGKRAG